MDSLWQIGPALKTVARALLERLPAEHPLLRGEVAATVLLRGLLEATDRSTAWLSRTQYAEIKTSSQGSFAGIYAVMELVAGVPSVKSLIKGAPAAGRLEPGDRVVAIDGAATEGKGLEWAVERIRGPLGSALALGVRRPGQAEPSTVQLTRAVVTLEAVEARLLAGKVALFRINTFAGTLMQQFGAAHDRLQGEATFGKGTVQLLYDFPEGGALKLTVAQYLGPGEEAFDARGIAPDLELLADDAAPRSPEQAPIGETLGRLRYPRKAGEAEDAPVRAAREILLEAHSQRRDDLLAALRAYAQRQGAR